MGIGARPRGRRVHRDGRGGRSLGGTRTGGRSPYRDGTRSQGRQRRYPGDRYPIEVRTAAGQAQLPGCAIRAVAVPAGTHPDSLFTELVPDPAIQLQVPPGQTRIVTLRLTDTVSVVRPTVRTRRDRIVAPVRRLWLRFDETVLDQTSNCPGVQTVSNGLQLYRVERADVEPGGLGIMAGAGMVIAVLVLAAR